MRRTCAFILLNIFRAQPLDLFNLYNCTYFVPFLFDFRDTPASLPITTTFPHPRRTPRPRAQARLSLRFKTHRGVTRRNPPEEASFVFPSTIYLPRRHGANLVSYWIFPRPMGSSMFLVRSQEIEVVFSRRDMIRCDEVLSVIGSSSVGRVASANVPLLSTSRRACAILDWGG